MPLATILRPKNLDEFIGQDHLVGANKPIRIMIEKKSISSMIFWGPPASGKTTLAEIIGNSINYDFLTLSAVLDGKDDFKKILKISLNNKSINKKTILFIDEIHRWSKSQQDILLPNIENGNIILIGATTENPSFTVISSLLSRTRVFVFKNPSYNDLVTALNRGLLYLNRQIDNDAQEILINNSNYDMRQLLNSLELASQISNNIMIDRDSVESITHKSLRYDKKGEEHYNLISAVHKSLRSSNATASAYWVMRMLNAGEDPLYIARRLIRFASEDIGNANTNALLLSNTVYETCQKLGMPECNTALIQLTEYLSNSPKSNKTYIAVNKANDDILKYGNLEVPMNIRNAPTKLMKDLGYGKNYEYDPDLESKKSNQQLMPDALIDRNYYT